jgi:CheY-like chemotaxis protein
VRANESNTAVCELSGVVSAGLGCRGRLLWVDDCQPLVGLYKAIFSRLGFEVQVACSPRRALAELAAQPVDLVIMDYEMPEMNGCELAACIKDRYPRLPMILYTNSVSVPEEARRWVSAVCSKAAPREYLLALIEENLGAASPNGQPVGVQVNEVDDPGRLHYRREPQRDSRAILDHEFRNSYTA